MLRAHLPTRGCRPRLPAVHSIACPCALQKILSPKGGFMGMVGERGIGGSKCGSTAAVALVYKSKVGVEPGTKSALLLQPHLFLHAAVRLAVGHSLLALAHTRCCPCRAAPASC